MKRLITSAVAAIALLTVGTTMLWSRAPAAERHPGNIGMPSMQELYTKVGVNTLPKALGSVGGIWELYEGLSCRPLEGPPATLGDTDLFPMLRSLVSAHKYNAFF
jgi:hypothetical protein